MAVRKIVIYPSLILRKKTLPVVDLQLPSVQEMVLKFAEDMEDTLEDVERNGAALAANQVDINLQMFVTNQTLTMKHGMAGSNTPEDPNIMSIPPLIINPEILKKSQETDMLDEGCLSFPGFGMKVRRHRDIVVRYDTLKKIDGRVEVEHCWGHSLSGFWAQCFQHEIDHLNGKLFVDSLPERKRLEIVKYIRGRK
jgi:peptide deformylase